MHKTPEVLIVGAGLAGLSAAIRLARAGVRVLVLEGAEFAGAENWTGGVLYAEDLLKLLGAELWGEAPKERKIVARALFLHDGLHAAGFEARANASNDYGEAWTVLRPKLDRWLAARAIDAGATLLTGTTVTGLRRDGERIVGVDTDRGPVDAEVVFIAEGDAAGLLASEGLERIPQPHFAQGFKAVFRLDAQEIERRFEVGAGEGVAQEWILRDGKLSGRGVPLHLTAFLYTNRDTLSVGAVLPLDRLAKSAVADHPHLLNRVLATPGLAGYLQDAVQVAYGAKVIRAGGLNETPHWVRDGLAIGGGGLGLGLEIPYPNFMAPAITSALRFAEAVLRLRGQGGGYTRAALEQHYVGPLKQTDDYANAELIKRWPNAIHGGPMLFEHLPALIGQLVDADELPRALARGQRRRALALQVARLRQDLGQGLRMALGMGPNLFTRTDKVGPLTVRFLVAHLGERPNVPPGLNEPLFQLLASAIGHFYGRRLPRFAQRLKYAWRCLKYVPGSLPRLLSLGFEAFAGGIHLLGDVIAYKWKKIPLAEFLLRPYHRHDDDTQRNLDWATARSGAASPVGWIAPLTRLLPDTRHLSVPMQVGADGARALRNVCPAEVYVVAGNRGGVASQFENCIKCESCRVTVPGIDWNRLSRHRFAYRVPGDGRYGYDSSVTTGVALPAAAPRALGDTERAAWQALYRALRERPAMVGSEWAVAFAAALGELPPSDAAPALQARLRTWLAQGKYGWMENDVHALLERAGALPPDTRALRQPADHAHARRERHRVTLFEAFNKERRGTLTDTPWSGSDRQEFLHWIHAERAHALEWVESLAAVSPGLAWIAANHYLAEAHAGRALPDDLAAPVWREADGLSNWMPGMAQQLIDAHGHPHPAGTVQAHGMGADSAQPVRRRVPGGLSGFHATPAMAAFSAALALGQAQVLRDRARDYAATRVQFRGALLDREGRETIGKFGAVKHMLAAIERGVLLLDRARAHAEAEPAAVLALTHAWMDPWMDAIPWMAGQIFGGMGFSEEEIFAPRYRDATLFSQWPAARERVTADPEFERRVLAGLPAERPVLGRAALAATRWREAYAELPVPQVYPAPRRAPRGSRPLVWRLEKIRYRSGGFLNGQLLAPEQVLTPEHYRRDPALRRARCAVLRLLRSGFRSPDPQLSYGRWIDRRHGMPDDDVNRLRAFNAFATVVPETLGGKGWSKAQYSVLSTLTMGQKDTSVGLLIMASTSIGTMPVLLGLDKDLPKLRAELSACLGDRAGWERLRADLDGLSGMLARPEPKRLKAALAAYGRHMQAMFLFPGSALKYLARNYLEQMQSAFGIARRRDLDGLGRALERLRLDLSELRRELEEERLSLDARQRAHERFLQFLGCGQISAFALTEPGAGSDTGGIQTRATLREVEADPLGNGFYRFVPHAGGDARVLAEGARFEFENRVPRYRLDDGSCGALDDSGWDLTAQSGERRIRAAQAAHVFHDIGTTARVDGKTLYRYWELTGSKMWITNGSVADRYSLYTQSEAGELAVMLERRSDGLRIGPNENKLGQRASPTNELTLDRVRVSADQVIGYRGHGQVNALETLSVGRGGLVMGCATLAERLLHDYAQEWRREPQLHAMAQAEFDRIETLAARLMGLMDRVDLMQGDFRIEAALSKYLASEGLHRILMWYEQLHGPMAASREEPIEKWRRDIRVLNIYEGTNEVQRFLALKDLPSLLKDGALQAAGDSALDAALRAFHNFAGPRLKALGATVWTDPDQQLHWFPVVEWAAQLYVWCALLERVRLLDHVQDPADREHVARLREHLASQARHGQALANRVAEDFAQLDARRQHPADANLLIASDLLNRTAPAVDAPLCVGPLRGDWVAVLRSRYEIQGAQLRWAGWHGADRAALDRLLAWAAHSPALRVPVLVCAPRGLEDRVQRLRAAGAEVLHAVEPAGGFHDAGPVAETIRTRWPAARRVVLGGVAAHLPDATFAAQLAGLLNAGLLADIEVLGAARRGQWLDSTAGRRRYVCEQRALVLTWDAKPTGHSDRFTIGAWLATLGSAPEQCEPTGRAARRPRPLAPTPAADVPERFTDPEALAAWLGQRFGAAGAAGAAEPAVATRNWQEPLKAAALWVTPSAALAKAGSAAPLRLLNELGKEFAVLAWGRGDAAPSARLQQAGLRGIWQLATEDPAPRLLAASLQHATRVVLDAEHADRAAALAAALGVPVFTGVLGIEDGHVTCSQGDYEVDFDLPARAVLVVANQYPETDLAAGRGPIALARLDAPAARVTAFTRWQQLAAARPGGLASARLIVDVGLGIGNELVYRELVPPLAAALAQASGTAVEIGATRKITQELKLLPADRQIGQTGIAVSPQLVLALGISGAPQHMSWLGREALVVAINRDPQAPIFTWHKHNPGPRVIACVGDLQDWVPVLTRCLAPGNGAQSS